MATATTTQTTVVDASLWWDPFNTLFTQLENAYASSDIPNSLEKKLKANFSWFLETLSRFKGPSETSRKALDAQRVKIGENEIKIDKELKDVALRISSVVCLDEVQSYLLVKRLVERSNATVNDLHPEIISLVMIDYYIERQCLLKCTRQILMHSLYFGSESEGSAIFQEAHRLISNGLESKLLSAFEDLLSSNYPEQMDIGLCTLWAEETLIEDNLILDILFLAYYESYCPCDAKCWKKLFDLYEKIVKGSCNFLKLAISPEAVTAIYHAKVQLQLILIEALNLESLLQMMHDNIPFRQGSVVFSEADIQDMDATISSCSIFEDKEAGPLILAWAVFLCLISSLPEKENNNLLMEIDHIVYVRQASEASSLGYFLEILQSNTLKDTEGPLLGYRSVLRTFISAFIASYEISLESDNGNLSLILDILCNIYRGEESLCIQFWDRDSFIDSPVRCLLSNLGGEFPYRIAELVSLLSALCEGAWPSECVFNFLDKSVGLSTPLEINNGCVVDSASRKVETRFLLDAPGVEGVVIPSKSKGQILRMIDSNIALVRWEHHESGVHMLLLRLAKELHYRTSEESVLILDLLSRLVTSNMVVCHSLLNAWNNDGATTIEDEKKHVRIDVVEIICALVKSVSPSVDGAVIMSMGVNTLSKMLKCLPSHVTSKAVKGNIFDVALNLNPFVDGSNSLSSGTWLLSGRLAKMLLIDCEQSDCAVTLSVLDFTMNLLDTGLETDIVLALVVFSVQYVLVNHEFWKYKMKHARWEVTVKVLEIMKKCISTSFYQKLGKVVLDILLCDASVHSALFRIVCTTAENLEKLQMSRIFEVLDIEGLQLAISQGLDVLTTMISASKDSSNLSVFHQAMLSPSTKPVPVVTAAISLISYYHNPTIQRGAARLLSELFIVDLSPYSTYSSASLTLDDKQVANFRKSIYRILSEQSPWNEDLIVAILKLLTCAAHSQPAFLTDVIASKECLDSQSSTFNNDRVPNETRYGSPDSDQKSIMHIIMQYVEESEDLLKSKTAVLLNLGNFLRGLWQGAPQYRNMLDKLKLSDKFWKHLTSPVMSTSSKRDKLEENTGKELKTKACRYQYQSIVLDILGYEMFFQKKMMHGRLSSQVPKLQANGTQNKGVSNDESSVSLKEIISTWCKSSSAGNLIKEFVTCEYDTVNHFQAKVAGCLFAVHVMMKLNSGYCGSLSVGLIEQIVVLSDKLHKLPAFSELLAQYAERSYSVGKELENLITSDLFYHIEGELEGRPIDNGPFKDLFQFLLDSKFLDAYKYKQDDDLLANVNVFHLYDTDRLKAALGLELWDLSAMKPFKEIAESMLVRLEDVNSIILHSTSKLSALKGLNALLYMHDGDLTANEASTGVKISEQLVSSCIDHICQCVHATIESLNPLPDASENVLDILSVQTELLLLLVRSLNTTPQPVLVLKTAGYGLKVLSSCRLSVNVGNAKELLLMLILNSVKSMFSDSLSGDVTDIEVSAESANASLGILPILCNCVESDHCTLALTAIDLIVKNLSTSSTWLPIIQKHLPLHRVVQKLQDINSGKTVSVVLKFFLNLAPLRKGAEMLLKGGIIASIRSLLSDFSECGPFSVTQSGRNFSNVSENLERPQSVWGLCLALLTAIIHSLGDGSSSTTTVEYVMVCILVEKASLISYYLSAPDFPSEAREKKRARGLKSNISLSDLNETHNTLTLMCSLASHRSSWNKVLKDMDSQLREKSIHLLAFISKAIHRPGELSARDAPLFCNPATKEEFEWFEKPSFINSKNGWFGLSALGCKLNPKHSSLSSGSTALVIRDQSNNGSNLRHTHFSDLIGVEIYKVAFLVLKFLCMQAEGAITKAEEVGFVDVDHFPELPMPEILHGLQDQGMVIITELCEANKTKQLAPELHDVCLLLLQSTVMALYLEFCVIQVCGMRPVLGYVETFSKEFRLLIRATDGYSFLKEPLVELKQIVSFVYPELVQSESFY